MKIGLSCSTIEPQLSQGKIDGIGMYTRMLLDTFLSQQLDITPLSFPSLKKKITSSLPNGKIFPLPYMPATISSLSKPLASLTYQHFKNKFDIVHITDHMIPRMTKTPIIATIHDALMFKHPEWYPSKFRQLKNTLRRETMKWATHFITISEAMVPELVEYLGIPEDKISVVYNGIADDWNHTISPEEQVLTLQKLKIPNQFILFTGTLQPKKNVSRLIHAYLELPEDIRKEYPLVIAGKAGWDTEESLAAIHKLQTQKAGFWLDYVTDHDIRVLYQTASLYVFPSLHEGFGLTLLEAFTSNTPVIASNIPALTEVANGSALLVDPYSITDIQQNMYKALTNPTLLNALKTKGQQRSQDFSLKKCAEATLKCYERIA